MNKSLKSIVVVFAFFFMANAANILVWNFNPFNYDNFKDPEAGQEVNASYWLRTTLSDNGYTFTYHDNTSLPADIKSYDIIVATTGFLYC